MTKASVWKSIVGCTFIVGILLGASHSPLSAQTSCSSQEVLSLSSGSVQVGSQDISSTRCFTITDIASSYDLITLSINVTSGQMDVYLAAESTASFSMDDQLNFNPVDSDHKFAIAPNNSTYTLAMRPSGSSTFSLWIGNSLNSQVVSSEGSKCSGSICKKMSPLTSMESASTRGVEINSQYGDRVIMPLRVYCPGRVTASASWSGSASQLALILNGPGQVGYYDRRDGSSGISISYDVQYSDLTEGNRWMVSLVNFSGGNAMANLDVTLPADNCASGTLRKLFYEQVEVKAIDFSYSPSGGWAMIWGSNGYWWYNVPSGFADALSELNNDQQTIKDIAFAPNGGWVIAYGRNGARWDNIPQDFADAFWELHNQNEDIRRVAFTASGGWAIIFGTNGRRSVGMSQNFNDNYTELNSQGRYINTIAFTPSGGWVIIFGTNGRRSAGMPDLFLDIYGQYNNEGSTIQDVAFTPDGGWVITRDIGRYYFSGIR